MKIKKMALAAVAVCSLGISLAACGTNDSTEKDKVSTVTTKKDKKKTDEKESTEKLPEITYKDVDSKVTIEGGDEAKESKEVSIKIEKAKLSDGSNLDGKEQVMDISFDITNNRENDFGVGSGDFQIVSEEKTYTSIGTKEDFGALIKAGESLQGTGSYVIPKELKSGKIVFQPVNPTVEGMEKLEWSFVIE